MNHDGIIMRDGCVTGCVMDVRTSSDVELLHVIGPADSTDDYNTVDREAESASAAAAKTAEVGLPGLLG